MINPQIVGVKKERTKELFNNYFLRASRNSYTQKHMNSTNLINSIEDEFLILFLRTMKCVILEWRLCERIMDIIKIRMI